MHGLGSLYYVLASLDELGSIHERSEFLFEYSGLASDRTAYAWIGVPVLAILFWTLKQLWQFASKRGFWLMLGGFVRFGGGTRTF